MGWASQYITQLQAGATVEFNPRGNSMLPRIRSGQLCCVAPIPLGVEPKVGDIVLCRVRGSEYLHLIKAVHGDRYQIGNNRGGINGWITRSGIFGILVRLGP